MGKALNCCYAVRKSGNKSDLYLGLWVALCENCVQVSLLEL